MDKIQTSLPIEGYCVSRQGGREENQDTCGYADTPYGLLVVICDGMGGGPAGKTASVIAVESIVKYVLNYLPEKDSEIDRQNILRQAIASAEKAIVAKQAEDKAYEGMGTTAVALLINNYSAVIAHVGDSRCYQFRFGKKKFRTADHSFVADLVRKGQLTEEQARLSSQSNIITKALSGRSDGTPFLTEVGYEKGDRFMLCTDGIWGAMPEKELIERVTTGNNIGMIVEKTASDVDEIGIRAGGGHDNLTLSLIKINKDSKYKEPMNRKYRNIVVGLMILSILSIALACYSLSRSSSKDLQIEELQNILGKTNVAELDKQIDSLKVCKKEADSSASALQKKFNLLQNQLNAMTNMKDSLNHELENQKNMVKSLKKQLAEQQTSLHAAEKETLQKIMGMISDLVKCTNQNNSEAKISNINKELDCITSKLKNTSCSSDLLAVKEELNKSIVTKDAMNDLKDPDKKREGQLKAVIKRLENVIKKL